MSQDEVSVHKNAKRELGQYPVILTELAWSIKDLLYSIKSTERKKSLIPCRYMKTVRAKQAKVHFAYFVQSDQHEIIAKYLT